MTHFTRSLVLRVDAITLALFGLFALVMDLSSYAAGIGPWRKMLFNNPLTVGAVEAHGLAIILAIVLIQHAAANDTKAWHLTAVASHLLLGICNLVFWQVFIKVHVVPFGIVATTYHFVFVIANSIVGFLPRLELAHT